MPPTGGADADGSAVGSSSSASKAKSFILDPPLPVVVHSTTLPTPNPTSGKALLCYIGSCVCSVYNDSYKKVGSIVGDLEVIEAIVSNLKVEDDDVIDSDGDIDGLNADDQSYFDM
ncbi:hypothetical protein ZEAMMB73_Zm00001d027945 [Zea mays]|uniref:Uncharacterized protein n=1 Tax=Zea mays TaxID=4577 RepID=A0A1D6JQY2_MAIZE|nr:hypothetical protein ZEAMMB73_Zm00001d027945 [Zea mays]